MSRDDRPLLSRRRFLQAGVAAGVAAGPSRAPGCYGVRSAPSAAGPAQRGDGPLVARPLLRSAPGGHPAQLLAGHGHRQLRRHRGASRRPPRPPADPHRTTAVALRRRGARRRRTGGAAGRQRRAGPGRPVPQFAAIVGFGGLALRRPLRPRAAAARPGSPRWSRSRTTTWTPPSATATSASSSAPRTPTPSSTRCAT